ncbi:MAG: PQQ-dependent sugar dehydrogenase [Anaerolineae bacterium]|nr:PQQ-dependent sugar dehydrogenase [Anaerolineae bacterium]
MKTLCHFSFLVFAILLVSIQQNVQAQSQLPACALRPHLIDPPWVNATYYCAELVIHDESGGEMGFTSLAAASDGTLYAARPLSGEVLALTDADGDGLPETPHIIAQKLTFPNGLAYDDNALYIAGGSHIYKWANNALTTLVDDLPGGAGFWTGGIAVGPDKRLYVSIGAACDACEQTQADRGTILSFALDGSDRQVVSSGLRQPNDLAFQNQTLWTVDTARDGLPYTTNDDELNKVTAGANFGWPYCVGKENILDTISSSFDCSKVTPPAMTFATHSNPLGIVAYSGEAFPHLKGQLLVTLGGVTDQSVLNGYTLVTIGFDANGNPLEPHIILPEIPSSGAQWSTTNLQKMHFQASGFWQHHPYDVTVSREGWIYVSLGGASIWALRPR